MTHYVALFRGINVGRAKRVTMADLRAVFVDLGYDDVRTVLQSGNVVFRATGLLAADTAARIEAELHRHTGVQAAVLLKAAEELIAISDDNPLLALATDPSRLLVTFLAEPPDPARLHIPDPVTLAPEVVRIGARAVYQWCPAGVLASKLPASFWRQFGPSVTARNWRTVTRLVNLVR